MRDGHRPVADANIDRVVRTDINVIVIEFTSFLIDLDVPTAFTFSNAVICRSFSRRIFKQVDSSSIFPFYSLFTLEIPTDRFDPNSD